MSRAKGQRVRRKVEKYFRDKGYLVANVEKSGHKYIKERDLFSTALEGSYTDRGFDLLALGRGNIILVQVKSNRPSAKSYYEDFSKAYADGYLEVLVATWVDYDGLRLQWYEPDGTITEQFIDSSELT